MVSRTTWGGATQQYYDTQLAQWQKLAQQFGFKLPWNVAKSIFQLPVPAPNQQVGQQQNDGSDLTQGYIGGLGRIVINGEPRAKYGGTVDLIGARPGVDGQYYIYAAEHMYSRQGYVTWLDVGPVLSAQGTQNVGAQGYELTDIEQRLLTGQPLVQFPAPPANTPGAIDPAAGGGAVGGGGGGGGGQGF
jgi:hypothetical protein